MQSSTALWERRPCAMREALEAHNALLRRLIERHGGYEVKTEGDAFMVAFPEPRAALRWCLSAQEELLAAPWPDGILQEEEAAAVLDPKGRPIWRGLRVRMGVHEGEPDCRIDPTTERMDYFGPMVNRSARVAAAAHGGQVVLSASAWAGVGQDAEPASARDLGEHHLKGLETPERIFEVTAPSLSARRFPALKTSDAPRTNLIAVADAFVGRGRELTDLGRMLHDGNRLLTVLGPGGTGKTRLAKRFAGDRQGDFPGGVWFCALAEARDLAGICAAVSAALGQAVPRGGDDQQVCGALGRVIASRGKTLLLLDNAEGAAQALAQAAPIWLSSAAEAVLLVTSRLRLRCAQEMVLDLAPLPPAQAVELFLARARAVRQGFGAGSREEAASVKVAERLEGVPLALEMAAARAGALTATAILERLGTGMASLRCAFKWSWGLLSQDDRRALSTCSVFRGGFDLGAAEAVLGPGALDRLESLRDASLLRVGEDPAGGGPRFSLLETIRQYAGEALEASGRTGEARSRHAAFYLERCELWTASLDGPHPRAALERLALEADNLRSICDGAEPAAALRATLVLSELLLRRGPYCEAVRRLESWRSSGGAAALFALGWGLSRAGRVKDSEPVLREAAAQAGSPKARSRALVHLGQSLWVLGRYEEARAVYDESLALARPAGDLRSEAMALIYLGALESEVGRLDAAEVLYRQALPLAVRAGDRRLEGLVLGWIETAWLERFDVAPKPERFEAPIAIMREVGDLRMEAAFLECQAQKFLAAGLYEEALRRIDAAAVFEDSSGDDRGLGYLLSRRGAALALLGRAAEADACLDRAQALHTSVGTQGPLLMTELHRSLVDLARARTARDAGDPRSSEGFLQRARRRAEEAAAGPVIARSDDARVALSLVRREVDRYSLLRS